MLKPNATFCEDCGSKFTERMHEQLYENGAAFCVHCGKGYVQELEIEQC